MGNEYLKAVKGTLHGQIDVYSVVVTFNVTCPARAHAVKKILCCGQRGAKDAVQDLKEAIDALERAIDIVQEIC